MRIWHQQVLTERATSSLEQLLYLNSFLSDSALLLITQVLGDLAEIYGTPIMSKYTALNLIISLSLYKNLCCWCSKEPSHRDGSFEYPQHKFSLSER